MLAFTKFIFKLCFNSSYVLRRNKTDIRDEQAKHANKLMIITTTFCRGKISIEAPEFHLVLSMKRKPPFWKSPAFFHSIQSKRRTTIVWSININIFRRIIKGHVWYITVFITTKLKEGYYSLKSTTENLLIYDTYSCSCKINVSSK